LKRKDAVSGERSDDASCFSLKINIRINFP
jgi:hypothetical protein